jgi:L-ascorbate metabolism protein UlaG (beta-lactamase superfamily)
MPRATNASAGLRQERVRASRQYAEGRFHNPSGLGPSLHGGSLPIIGEYFFGGGQRKPPAPLPLDDPRPAWARASETGLRVTWLGHSTVLLEVDGVRILTDPVFGERASPVSFAGPRRFHRPPAPIAALPPLDLVLLSHDHYDHLCRSSMVELAKRGVPIVTALGVGGHLEKMGIPAEQITELDWGEETLLPGERARIAAAPAQHFSGRGVADRNRTLWASWVIRTERHRLFFSGDTGMFPGFADIGRQYGPFDLVMLEVGAYHPAWGHIHLGPENALLAHEALGGRLLLPVHWGTFNLALHDWDEPAETLHRVAGERGARLLLPRLGSVAEPSRLEHAVSAPWWRDVRAAATAPGPVTDRSGSTA